MQAVRRMQFGYSRPSQWAGGNDHVQVHQILCYQVDAAERRDPGLVAGRELGGRLPLAARRLRATRTPRSMPASRPSSPPASACCSRSTCRVRWRRGEVGSAKGLTPRVASCAMALVTAATERGAWLVAFYRRAGRAWWSVGRRYAGHHDPVDLAASAAGRRGRRDGPAADGRDGLRAANAVGAAAGDRCRHVLCLHR